MAQNISLQIVCIFRTRHSVEPNPNPLTHNKFPSKLHCPNSSIFIPIVGMPVFAAATVSTVSGGSLAFRSQKFFTNDCCSSNSYPLQHVNFPRSKRRFLLSPKVSLSIGNNDAIGNHTADNVDGQQSLSPDTEIKPTRSVDWETAKTYAERSLIYKAKVTGFNSGGLLVRFYGLVGFLPYPELSPNHWCKDLHKKIQEIARGLTGSFLYVKVIRVDEDKKQLLLSERQASWSKYSNQITVGDVLQGRVGVVEDYGAFVNILFPDGSYHLAGLVHVSEVSWDFVRDVRDILTKGDDVRVKILNIDRENFRMKLSIKQLEEDPLLETLEKVIPKRLSSDTNSLDSNSSFVIEPLPGLETIIEELMREDGIYDVTISRQGFEKRVVSQDLQLWLSNEPATGDQCTLLARAGRQVQEIQLKTSLDQVGIKMALQRVLERVP